MTVALGLWAYALALALSGASILRWAGWVDRAPRLGIIGWQALSAAIVLAVALGGLSLMIPLPAVSASLSGYVEACAMAIQGQYATPGGAALATLGMLVAAGGLGRALYGIIAQLSVHSHARRRHLEVLSVLGQPGRQVGTTLVQHDVPVAYCVAGRPHRIVLTTATEEVLDATELDAVLAHEHAHLRGRHDLAVSVASGLARAFPRVHVFRTALAEITRLVELVADDHATRTASRLTLAEAMLTLASQPAPEGALAASASESVAAARIRRLIVRPRPVTRWITALGVMAAGLLIAVPLIALTAPAATATDCCPPETHVRVDD